MLSHPQLDAASAVIRRHIMPSPQIDWPLLSARAGTEVVVKHENHLPTGAFKVRGGLVYASTLDPGTPGLVSATRGNHGQSLAFAGRGAGVSITIVVPRGNSPGKNAAMAGYGATVVECGEDFEEAREEAFRLAATRGLIFVPSFAPLLVQGVATYALELFTVHPDLDTVYVPIGLGSGICGTILVRDLLGLSTKVVGVQSTGADCYAQSFAAGAPVAGNRADTRADGIAVRQPDPEALRIILAGADRIVTVSDAAIGSAIRAYWTDTHNLVEGAGAAPLAALLQERETMRGRKVGLIASGGNIDLSLFHTWVGADQPIT
jgi:threonine dehydratase